MRELYDMVVAEIRGSWRFRWTAVAIAWIVALLGWAVVYLIPNEFDIQAYVFDQALLSGGASGEVLQHLPALDPQQEAGPHRLQHAQPVPAAGGGDRPRGAPRARPREKPRRRPPQR